VRSSGLTIGVRVTIMDKSLSLISVTADAGRPNALVLRVGGEVDISTVGEISRAVQAMIATRRAGQDVLIIDLDAVTFFGSTGVAALVECQHEAEQHGVGLRVAGTSPAVLRPLNGTGLVRCFDWYDDLDSALAASTNGVGPPSVRPDGSGGHSPG
jgi:anti-sigma B factor antagonist